MAIEIPRLVSQTQVENESGDSAGEYALPAWQSTGSLRTEDIDDGVPAARRKEGIGRI
jgi:hypothetical protein